MLVRREVFISMNRTYYAICQSLLHMRNNPKTVKWTQDTIMCKKRGCVCEGCFLKKYNCHLKSRVIALVRVLGKPEGITEPTILPRKKELKYLFEKYSKSTVRMILGVSQQKIDLLEKEVLSNE